MKFKFRSLVVLFIVFNCVDIYSQTFDINGLNYKSVLVGAQTWMAENLNVDEFKNGDSIPQAKTQLEWMEACKNKSPAWCYYENDIQNGDDFGKLYNWYAVSDERGLAPDGWHIPSNFEWREMFDYLGGINVAGNKLKSKEIFEIKTTYYEVGGYYEKVWVACNNCSYWTEKQRENFPCTVCRNTKGKYVNSGKYLPKTSHKRETKELLGGWNGTNESGFNVLPGGKREANGNFFQIQENSDYWSSSLSESRPIAYAFNEHDFIIPLQIQFKYDSQYNWYIGNGLYIRCIKD